MIDTILQTKLYIPPTRPNLVPRPHLIEKLNRGLQQGRKLTLISAPAGFGKTTLLSEWMQQCKCAIAWISLDEGDNDPARFLNYLIAALSQAEGPVLSDAEGKETAIGEGALSMLQSPQPPPTEAILTSLINEVAAIPGRIILILDDYHTIESPPVDKALIFFLEHLPPQLHLVIATRVDPSLPLARLRARGQLLELRAADLRFTSVEAAEFLNQVMGMELAAEDIAVLETRTEGWIAGLQLAALALRGRENTVGRTKSFTGSHRFVLDYLIEEVLEQQSESVQSFLLQTAVLSRLTGSLCDAVCSVGKATSQNNGQTTLEMLEHANLFIVPLDDERRWYRYHHLFADLLRQQLRRKHPDWIPTLHRRASEWYEQNGFADEAIRHALRAEDFERAAYLIETMAEAVWVRGEDTKLRRWLDRLPEKLLFSKPQLCIFHAWSLFAAGQQGAAERSLQAAEQALDPSADRAAETAPREQDRLPTSDRMELRGRAAATRAFMAFYQGDVPGIIQYARLALKYLPEQDLSWRSIAANALADAHDFKGEIAAAYQTRIQALEVSKAAGNNYQIMIANLKLAIILRQQGHLQQVIEICRQQMQIAEESGMTHPVVVGFLLAIWGEILAEMNDLDEALHQGTKGVELAERGGDVAMISWSYQCLTRVLFSRGDMAGAEKIVQKMENMAREYNVPPWIENIMAGWQARIWLAQNKLEAVHRWVASRKLDADDDITYMNEMEYVVLARILIAQGRVDEAIRLIQPLLEAAETMERVWREIELLILKSLAFQAKSDTDQAMVALKQALTLAEPCGFIRTFVDEGPSMARLLYEALSQDIAPDYVRQLLAAFPVSEPEQSTPPQPDNSEFAWVEPLSEREVEVLQLIAEGLTNKEVGSRLYLSLNTVKSHTRNIYSKLGVNNRMQAVARARDLGILSST